MLAFMIFIKEIKGLIKNLAEFILSVYSMRASEVCQSKILLNLTTKASHTVHKVTSPYLFTIRLFVDKAMFRSPRWFCFKNHPALVTFSILPVFDFTVFADVKTASSRRNSFFPENIARIQNSLKSFRSSLFLKVTCFR